MFVASEDYEDQGLRLDARLIKRPAATFFMAAAEDAPEAGVRRGDLLIVDRAEPPSPGRVAIAPCEGELRVLRLGHTLPPELWGVVLWVVRAP
jgi:DNA polymerase V